MIRQLKLILATFIGLGILAFASAPVLAADFDLIPACTDNSSATACAENNPNRNTIYGPNGIITKIANILAIIIGVAAVIVIIVAGIQYMVSTGDPTKVNNAKNAIIYAIVGLVIAVLARTLVIFIIGKLGK
jgi:hypothetical protein